MAIRIGHLSTFYHTAVLLMARAYLAARLGDEVVLFGEQDRARIDLTEVAERAETIPYEILCRIPQGRIVP